MAKIFFSYKREESPQVKIIVEGLIQAGHSVFWDAKLRAAADFIQKLNHELLAADCVIVAWSRQSITSPWVISECIKGFHRQVLLPVRIDGVTDHEIPMPFNILQCVDLSV